MIFTQNYISNFAKLVQLNSFMVIERTLLALYYISAYIFKAICTDTIQIF